MIKTISYWSMKDGLSNTHPIEDALKTAKAEGFQAIELCIAPDGVLSTQTTQAECEKIRQLADKIGVKVETLAAGITWGSNPTSNDAATRKRSIELHSASLQRAAWLGVETMLFVPGVVKSPISPDVIRYDHAVNRCREACKALLDTAEKVGVNLGIENVWNGMFYSPLEFAQFVDDLGSKRAVIYFDAGNVLGYHQHPPFWIELLGKRINRVHIKDFKQSIGTLAGFCDLLAGDVPWKETMAALRAIGYTKTIVAEMIPWDPGMLSRTSAALDKILAM
jgi:L-ribulose-5-phosphate 3-epimerase